MKGMRMRNRRCTTRPRHASRPQDDCDRYPRLLGLRFHSRRGVASVLAMMFLVIFASLASVMAVVAQGNLRTAQSFLQVNRALSAAETGLTFATMRMGEAASRFIVEKGNVDAAFGDDLWTGAWDSGDGAVTILPPTTFTEETAASSLAEAILNAHDADSHNLQIEPGDEFLPAIDEQDRLILPPVGLTSEVNTAYFRLIYEPLLVEDEAFIRVTSTGYDGDLTRRLVADYQITKKLDAAIISSTRVMIGKNVHIDGPIGSRYGELEEDLDEENGHPIVLRSDFLYLDATLDSQIESLVAQVAYYDVDRDNRLRPGHPSENEGLTEEFMTDYDGDGYVDDYDLWVQFYDEDGDGWIAYDTDLADAAGLTGLTEEFVDTDDQLVAMIDSLNPDRDGDGDVDSDDVALGYLDGVINRYDGYTKVEGELLFKTSKSAWESAQGGISVQEILNGPIRTSPDSAPMSFEVDDTRLYDLTASNFTNSQTALKDMVIEGTFWDQVAAQLGGDPNAHTWSDHPAEPDYNRDGIWEQMPLGSPGFYDWYQRPIFKNMTFVNTDIPMGLNALFDNCTFVGAVYVRSFSGNGDALDAYYNWNYLGMLEEVGGDYLPKYDYENWDPELDLGAGPVYDTKPYSNNLRIHDCTIIGSIVADKVDQFTHVRNKIQFTGDTQFSLDVDDIGDHGNLSEEEQELAESLFESGAEEFEKSSLMAPNYSVDIGNFENSGATVYLKGTIVAGVADIRGNAHLFGTLLMTYRPVDGEGALYYGGNTAQFNTTIGYFGPEDGDGEGEEPSAETGYGNIVVEYNPDQKLPDGILAPIRIEFVPGSYTEGIGS